MLKEMLVMAAFILVLSGIIGSIVSVQKISERQRVQAVQIMEMANEID